MHPPSEGCTLKGEGLGTSQYSVSVTEAYIAVRMLLVTCISSAGYKNPEPCTHVNNLGYLGIVRYFADRYYILTLIKHISWLSYANSLWLVSANCIVLPTVYHPEVTASSN
jgi:hypothetical protein